jgi:hypothetical protein
MVFWVVGKRVNVDTFSWGVTVMLIRLDKSEVSSITFRETVMSVELKLGGSRWVVTIIISMLGGKVAVMKIFIVSRVNVVITSNNPDNFLTRVVEIQLDLVGETREGFFSLELKLFNQILVLSLSETTTFIGIKEDIVNVKTSVSERVRTSVVKTSVKFSVGTEFDLEFNFMILKCD